jgi:hypothetical protein
MQHSIRIDKKDILIANLENNSTVMMNKTGGAAFLSISKNFLLN